MAFDIYKRGQGKYTRLGTALGVTLLIGLGCYRLFVVLQAANFSFGPKTTLWVTTMVPVCVFGILSVLTFWLVNRASVADFMIAAEGEVKKVSWSSRQEITASTIVVIVVVVIMAALLYVIDLIFQLIFNLILGR